MGHYYLAIAGGGLLAASLVVKKKAVWAALAGGAVLTVLAVQESDPTLALGVFALVATVLCRPSSAKFPRGNAVPRQTAGMSPAASPESSLTKGGKTGT